MSAVDVSFHPADASRGPRVFVLAELGVNHDGDPAVAERLIDAAVDAGADGVKLQHFHPRRLLSREAGLAAYQQAGEADAASMLGRLALDVDAIRGLAERAHGRGLAFVVTPFSLSDADELAGLPIDAVKIASPDVVNTPLLDRALRLGLPTLVSTGAAALDEVAPAAVMLHRHARPAALLQCVSAYPTADTAASLGGIAALAAEFKLPVGYSDHTASDTMGGLAVAAGACVLEKHLTHDRAAPGPDHAASLEPDAFGRYVAAARAGAVAVGPRAKRVLDVEQEVRRLCRQGLYAARDLIEGHTLAAEDIAIQRPAAVLPAAAMERVVGRRLRRAVAAGEAFPADAIE